MSIPLAEAHRPSRDSGRKFDIEANAFFGHQTVMCKPQLFMHKTHSDGALRKHKAAAVCGQEGRGGGRGGKGREGKGREGKGRRGSSWWLQ